MAKIRLGVNIDHVATVRNARGGSFPSPIRAALIAKENGADIITAHLREDRRHIQDRDIIALQEKVDIPLNLEVAATDEMLDLAKRAKPYSVCIVPEKREELTTEGGLKVSLDNDYLRNFISELKAREVRVALFLEPNIEDVSIAKKLGADIIEFHTGKYAYMPEYEREPEYERIVKAVNAANALGLDCHAGHGLNFKTAEIIAKVKHIKELNIGHFIVGESIFVGLPKVIQRMKQVINRA
jgi:pyridoxine 5-phosphate synthase